MIRLRDLLKEETPKKETPYMSGDTYIGKEDAMRVYKNMEYDFNFSEFHMGMNVELEHQDVTEGSLIKTGMIYKNILNYYGCYFVCVITTVRRSSMNGSEIKRNLERAERN